MNIKARYLSIHELGQRSNQEDSIFPAIGQKIAHNDLFILCDGMGGHDQGEVASQTVCDALSEYISNNPNADFESALSHAYDALDSKDSLAEKKMGTTLTLIKFEEEGCIVAHIGDSRVYQIRPSEKKIVFVTKDHSLVNDLIDCGELTPEEAKHSSQKNVITRAMQPHQEKRTKADISILTDIRKGDYIYMCSDGMLEISEDQDIVNVISMNKSDEEKIEILRRVTKDNKDNHSAHLIHIVDVKDSSPSLSKPHLQKRSLWPIAISGVILITLLAILLVPRKSGPIDDNSEIEMFTDTIAKDADLIP